MQNRTRTALRLLIATPLAASAIALGGFTDLAHAETPGFEPNTGGTISLPQDDEDPKPQGPGDIGVPDDEEDPKPQGPGDIGIPEDEEDPKPEGPDDIGIPEDDDQPDGPDDITNPEPGDNPDGPDDLTNPEPGDNPEDVPGDEVPADQGETGGKGNQGGSNDVAEVASVEVPNRIDAGAGPVAAPTAEQDLTLTWMLAGGGLVVAAGSLLARQRVAQRTR